MSAHGRKQAAGAAYFSGRRPRVLGHRGTAGTHPENTLVSFRQALADGADVLEMDVHLTKDKQVVVCHDATVDRTTNGRGKIAEMTLAEIRKLDAGYRFKPQSQAAFTFRGQGIGIPTFEEVLSEFPNAPMNVEIKANSQELVNLFFAALKKHGRMNDVTVLVAGNVHSLVRKIRRKTHLKMTGFSRREVAVFMLLTRLGLGHRFKPRGGRAFQVPVNRGRLKIVTPKFVRAAHKLGLEVHVWTINDEKDMQRLLDMGVDGLFTDFPGVMRRLVDQRCG